jgi:hypothetical protein
VVEAVEAEPATLAQVDLHGSFSASAHASFAASAASASSAFALSVVYGLASQHHVWPMAGEEGLVASRR